MRREGSKTLRPIARKRSAEGGAQRKVCKLKSLARDMHECSASAFRAAQMPVPTKRLSL